VDPSDGSDGLLVCGATRLNHRDPSKHRKRKKQAAGAAAEAGCCGGWLLRRTAATAADGGGCCSGRPAAGTKRRRDALARGLELEAALTAEAAWGLKDAVASMAALDMEMDSPPHLPVETPTNKVSLLSFLCRWFDYSFHICSLFLGLYSAINPSSDRD